MADFNLALTESKSLRDNKLSEYSNEKALGALNKAKALVMAFWKGEHLATTKQIADYYQVSEDVVWQIAKRNKEELESDGLTKKTGKELKALLCKNPDKLSVSGMANQASFWTPRAALRLGMLLRDSEVAKHLRTIILDAVSTIPSQQEDIEVLKIKLELAKLENDKAQAELAILQKREYITTALPEPMQQKILGYQVIEKTEYRDRIIKDDDLINDGSTVNKSYLCRRFGFISKAGNPNYKQLDYYLSQLPDEAFDTAYCLRENKEVKREFLEILDRLVTDRPRQLFLGE